MSDILDNELVQKYFGCGCETAGCLHPHEAILRSMEEPIRKGDKYLTIRDGYQVEEIANLDCSSLRFHPHYLRLPDKFQVAGKMQGHCETCSCRPYQPPPAADPVEEKIMKISTAHGACSGGWEHELRELVELARAQK